MNRLRHPNYGIITEDGLFKVDYMYYFFLGMFLAKNKIKDDIVIEEICEASYVTSNYLTLLFIIHHTNDSKIIDEILLRTICTLDTFYPAKLNREETKRFGEILANLPEDILSNDSIEEGRGKERDIRDINDGQIEEDKTREAKEENPVNNCYRILKSNEIMGQILRNKYGTLERSRIEEIIEIIADSGLRLVNFVLKDEEEIAELARYLHEKFPDHDIRKIKSLLRTLSFIWTISNIEKIVSAINVPEIREAVNEVVRRQSTPAYDLIGYFNELNSAEKLTSRIRDELGHLLKIHKDPFLKRVLSIRTQHYMNTHHSGERIEQSICSLLKIKYSPKYFPPNT